MSWTFKQSTGEIFTPAGAMIEVGYAGGAQGDRPDGVNNPAQQMYHDVGPLPQGIYHIGTAYNHPKLGAFVLPLYPHPENNMFGRAGFFIHGDRMDKVGLRAASDGCIIVSRNTRDRVNISDDKEMLVIA